LSKNIVIKTIGYTLTGLEALLGVYVDFKFLFYLPLTGFETLSEKTTKTMNEF